MADVTVAVPATSVRGTELDILALNTSDRFLLPNDGRTILVARKIGNGATSTFTFETVKEEEGLAIADRVVTVTGGASDAGWKEIGPFRQDLYNDEEGKVRFTVDDVNDLEVVAVRIT